MLYYFSGHNNSTCPFALTSDFECRSSENFETCNALILSAGQVNTLRPVLHCSCLLGGKTGKSSHMAGKILGTKLRDSRGGGNLGALEFLFLPLINKTSCEFDNCRALLLSDTCQLISIVIEVIG